MKYGVNPDSESVYLKDQLKYDIEGPKNLFDTDQMIEWLVKQCNEHPLIEYLEDPIVDGDPAAYQRLLKRFKEAAPRVKIGIKNWFKSNFDNIKNVFLFIVLKFFYRILKSYRKMMMMKRMKRLQLPQHLELRQQRMPLLLRNLLFRQLRNSINTSSSLMSYT